MITGTKDLRDQYSGAKSRSSKIPAVLLSTEDATRQRLIERHFTVFHAACLLMKHSSRLLRPCGLLLVAVLLTPAVEAATRTKANNNTNLNVAGSWDALPGVNDIARWNSTVTAATAGSPFPLGGDVSWLGIQIVNPGAAVTITGAQTITLGGPGVNASSYPSGASIDMSTATQDLTISANLRLLANSGQIWNVQTGRVLTLNGTTFTRSAGATLNIVGAGTVATTNISNDVATGLIGAWASQGTGTATRYATVSGGNIVAYTGGTAAATAAGVTATNGTENYDVAAVTGPLGAGASINTLRYTGAAGTIAGNLEVNGLMNAGAGTLTMSGNITIGASRELVANSTVGLTLSGAISDNAGGASALTKSGNGTLTLSGDNDYTGATVVSRGVLAITHSNALGATGVGAGTTVYTAPGGRLQLSNNITVNEEITFVSGDPNSTNSTGLYNASGNNTLLGQLKPLDQLRMGGAGGAILNIRGGVTGTNTFFVLNPGGGTFSFTDQPVAIGAGGSFYLDQSGTVILGVTGNSFGRTLVAGGTMRMGVAGALPSTMSKIEVGVGYSPNGTLDLDGYSQTAVELKSGSFRSPATRLITSATAATLTINQPTNTTYDGRITGAVALTKSGAGTLTLQGDNAHTGDTVISGGALLIHNVAASGQTGNYSTTLNSANATVTGLSTANLVVGQAISGSGIPVGAFISGITNATTVSVTLPTNAGATGTTSTAVTFAALDGSLAGSTVNYDNQGGLLRFGYSTTSATLGGLKGDQNLSLLNTNAAPAGVAL